MSALLVAACRIVGSFLLGRIGWRLFHWRHKTTLAARLLDVGRAGFREPATAVREEARTRVYAYIGRTARRRLRAPLGAIRVRTIVKMVAY